MHDLTPQSGRTEICRRRLYAVFRVGLAAPVFGLPERFVSVRSDRTNGCASPRLIVYSATTEGVCVNVSCFS